MSKLFTSNSLIASVKRRAMIPVNQSTFENSDFLEFANEEMVNELLPEIMRLHEDYLLYSITRDIVPGNNRFAIPDRAIANKLRDVVLVDDAGNTRELTRIGIDDVSDHEYGSSYHLLPVFFVDNNEVVIGARENTYLVNGRIRFIFYIRPNQLVEEDRASRITSIQDGVFNGQATKILSLPIPLPFPDNFTTATDPLTGLSSKFDIIQAKSPFVHLSIDLTPLSIDNGTKTITFLASDLSDKIAVGDLISNAEETIVPQVPQEVHSLLAHKTAMRCQEAMGDLQAVQIAENKHQRMQDRMTNLLDNRVESAPKKIRNKFSPLAMAVSRRSVRRGR